MAGRYTQGPLVLVTVAVEVRPRIIPPAQSGNRSDQPWTAAPSGFMGTLQSGSLPCPLPPISSTAKRRLATMETSDRGSSTLDLAQAEERPP